MRPPICIRGHGCLLVGWSLRPSITQTFQSWNQKPFLQKSIILPYMRPFIHSRPFFLGKRSLPVTSGHVWSRPVTSGFKKNLLSHSKFILNLKEVSLTNKTGSSYDQKQVDCQIHAKKWDFDAAWRTWHFGAKKSSQEFRLRGQYGHIRIQHEISYRLVVYFVFQLEKPRRKMSLMHTVYPVKPAYHPTSLPA